MADPEKEKREKIEQALGAFAGGEETEANSKKNFFTKIPSSDPSGSWTGSGAKGKRRRSRELSGAPTTEKGFLDNFTGGGTLSRNSSRKSKSRRSSITMFVDQCSSSGPSSSSSSNSALTPSSSGSSSTSISPIPFSLSPRSISGSSKGKKRRGSLFMDPLGDDYHSLIPFRSVSPSPRSSPRTEIFEGPDDETEAKHRILKTKNFKSLTHIQIIDLMEDVAKNPTVDDVSMLGLVRQMSRLFADSPGSLRRIICETFTQIEPFQLALQTLLIITVNISDPETQPKSANFLTSVISSYSSSFSLSFCSASPSFDELFKGCEFLFWRGANDCGGSKFVKNCVSSVQGVLETQYQQMTLTEEMLKKELERKEKEGSFVVLGWLLCCVSDNAKVISESSSVTDTILEILKKEQGVYKALALIVLFHLFIFAKYKTSTSILREIVADDQQNKIIVELANSLKNAQKKKHHAILDLPLVSF